MTVHLCDFLPLIHTLLDHKKNIRQTQIEGYFTKNMTGTLGGDHRPEEAKVTASPGHSGVLETKKQRDIEGKLVKSEQEDVH